MFDPHFTSRLETDNRTIWASRLDDEQLAGLICALGNFQERCYVLAEQLDEHRAEIDPADSDYARARTLLQRLSDLDTQWRLSVPPWRLIADAIGTRGSSARRTEPTFTGEFRRRLEESKHKYLPWALYLTEDHLFAILATIGELAPLIHLIDAQLDRHQGELFIPRVAYARARTVLGILAEMVHGTRLTFDDVHARIYLAIRKAQERTHRPGNWWTD
jgi:hypothetical protein